MLRNTEGEAITIGSIDHPLLLEFMESVTEEVKNFGDSLRKRNTYINIYRLDTTLVYKYGIYIVYDVREDDAADYVKLYEQVLYTILPRFEVDNLKFEVNIHSYREHIGFRNSYIKKNYIDIACFYGYDAFNGRLVMKYYKKSLIETGDEPEEVTF